MDDPDDRPRRERRRRPPQKQPKAGPGTPPGHGSQAPWSSFEPPVVREPVIRRVPATDVDLPTTEWERQVWPYRHEEVRDPTAGHPLRPPPERLPARLRCVLARDEPGPLLHHLAALRNDVQGLALDLRHDSVYTVRRELDAVLDRARRSGDDARRTAGLVRTGRRSELRQDGRYAGFVSVRDRPAIDDGGLRMIGALLDDLADTPALRLGVELAGLRGGVVQTDVRESVAANARRLTALVDGIAVDLTAADLTAVPGLTPAVLYRALWTSSTVWPTSVARTVRPGSVEVSRDVFQVVNHPVRGDSPG